MKRELEFRQSDHKQYGTASVYIQCAIERIERADVQKLQVGRYGWDTLPIALTPKQVKQIKWIERDVNSYLDKIGWKPITLTYGNKIYPRIHGQAARLPRKGDNILINLEGIFQSKDGKQPPPLFVLPSA